MAELSDRTAEVTRWHVLIIYVFEKFSANLSRAASQHLLTSHLAFQPSPERNRRVNTGVPLYCKQPVQASLPTLGFRDKLFGVPVMINTASFGLLSGSRLCVCSVN